MLPVRVLACTELIFPLYKSLASRWLFRENEPQSPSILNRVRPLTLSWIDLTDLMPMLKTQF